ncbi:hypothetical protein QCA50_014502 [Cerrena zonata]|uniref:Protein kinase domain-containing protein n=1 Tax=Cerrena zonata TaxID=2478898 RepID=A0AAW0FVK1_9APHY
MMELTGEQFTPEILQHAYKRDQYFNENGTLRRISDIFPGSIASALENYKILDKDDLQPTADFIASCLRLDPLKRPSAKELQLAPWLKDAFTC